MRPWETCPFRPEVPMTTMLRRPTRLIAAVALLVTATAAAAAPWGAAAQATTRPLLIDTDLGADDVLALAALVNDPTLDIQAITIPGTGQASCAAGIANLRALLVALDATGPEVGCGSAEPVGGGTPFPGASRTAADALHGLALPPAPDAGAPTRTAEAILGSLLDNATDPLSILELGPMTTLAHVLGDPDRAVRVASVTATAGALDVPGNVTPDGAAAPGRAEWNAHADPGALDAVLASGVPLTLVTLDALAQAPLTQTLVDGLRAGGDDASATLVAQLLAADPSLAAGASPGDALTALTLSDPGLIETRERMLLVATEGPDAGALTEADLGLPAQVTISADRSAFEVALLGSVRDQGGSGVEQPAGTLTITGGSATCTFDTGGTTKAGLAIVDAQSADVPIVAIIAGLSEGYGIADVEQLLTTTSPIQDPPDWLLLAAYLEVDAGGTADDTAELTPGDYVAICATGVDVTPSYQVAPTLLTITE